MYIDILIIHYGGFLKLLRNAIKWEKKKVIDYHDAYKGRALYKMNKSKIFAPLIVVDPIMPEGNIPSTTASKEPIEEPTLSPLPKIVEVIKSKIINVHSEPKIESGNIVHQLMTGARVPYADENKGWYQVELDNGEKGWVIKKYTKLLE